MAVRRIPIHTRSVTGKVATTRRETSIRTESSLETDFAVLMEFDPAVRQIEEQPVRIAYADTDGSAHTYVPDFLVTFHDSAERPLLTEIKYQSELTQKAQQFEARFTAARLYAEREGWTFEVYTEEEIRTPLLHNLKFLKPFARLSAAHPQLPMVLEQVRTLRLTTPRDLLDSLTPLPALQAQLLPPLWHLLGCRTLAADLTQPLTMTTLIWPACGQETADDAR